MRPFGRKKINHTALRELLIFVNNKKNKFVNNNKNKKPADADTLEHMKRLMDNFLTIAYRGEDALNRAIKVYEERVDVIENDVLKNKTIENFDYLSNVYDKWESTELTLNQKQIEKLRCINECMKSEHRQSTRGVSEGWDLGNDEYLINYLLKDDNLDNIYHKSVPYLLNEIAGLRLEKLTKQTEVTQKDVAGYDDSGSREIIQQIDKTCEKELTLLKYLKYCMGYWRAYFESCRDSSNEHENYCYTEEDLNNGKEVNQTNLYAALTLYTNLNKTLNKHDIWKNPCREDLSKIHPQEYQEVTQTNWYAALTLYTKLNKRDRFHPSREDLSNIYQLNPLRDKIDACLKKTEHNLLNQI